MAYSFEDYDQCYLENVTALGGKATKLDGVANGEVETEVETEAENEEN